MAIAITYRFNRNKVIPRIGCRGFIEVFHKADALPMNNSSPCASAFRAMNAAPVNVYEAIWKTGSQKDVVV
jgi:hypothetical protein